MDDMPKMTKAEVAMLINLIKESRYAELQVEARKILARSKK